MKSILHEPASIPNKGKVVLYTNTPSGYIYIEKINESHTGLKAYDNDNKIISEAESNETGLRWLKISVRGWHHWGRHNWQLKWTIDYKTFND